MSTEQAKIDVHYWPVRRPPDAAVPRRFGLLTLLGALTLFSVTFLVLETLGTPGWLVLHVSLILAAVSLSQMFFPQAPRWASIMAGTLYMPLGVLGMAVYLVMARDVLPSWQFLLWMAIVAGIAVPVGAFLGYLVGTLMAGLFLARRSIEARRPLRLVVARDVGELATKCGTAEADSSR